MNNYVAYLLDDNGYIVSDALLTILDDIEYQQGDIVTDCYGQRFKISYKL